MKKYILIVPLLLGLAACSPVTTYESGEIQDHVLEPAFKPAADVLAADISIVVATPRPRAGFDTRAMLYQDGDYTIDRFARNQWVASPAQMLGPLLVEALENSGRFAAVFASTTPGQADWRLDTDDVQLIQEFRGSTSQVRLSFRVALTDTATRRVLLSRDLEVLVPAPGGDPGSGVQASNRAVADLLRQVVGLCTARLPQEAMNAG